MTAFEFNKMAAAVLSAGIVFMAINVLVDELWHEEAPEVVAYPVPIAKPEAPAEEETAAVEKGPTFAEIIAAGDPVAGVKVFKKCATCHDASKGGPNKVGPNLYGVLGRPSASVAGYPYSDAMKNLGITWGYAELFAFLEAPKKYVPGTKMSFGGLKKPLDRAHVLAYLREHSDNPPPLPSD